MKPSKPHILQADYWLGQADSRPVAVFRILLALLLLKDAFYHLPLSRWFYSDAGIVPRRVLFDGLARYARLSLMDMLAHDWQAFLFFLLWIAVLLLLLVGYRTRTMTILNFILLLSVHERNIYILTGADSLFRAFSFWLMFAPAGDYYSIDALRHRWRTYLATGVPADLRASSEPRTAFALPLRMMQLQLVLIYLMTGYLKAISDIWRDGDALFYVLQLESLLLPPGFWLRDLAPDWLLTFFSQMVMVLELALPFMLLFPLWQPMLRAVGMFGGLLLHGGIALALSIPDFSTGMLATYVLFFEPEWLVRAERRLRQNQTPSIITRMPGTQLQPALRFLLMATSPQDIHAEPDLSDDGLPEPDSMSLHVCTIDRQAFVGAGAWRRLAGHLPLSKLWAWILRIRPVRKVIAYILRRLMPTTTPHTAQPPPTQLTRIWPQIALTGVMLPLMAMAVWWNIEATWQYKEHPILPPPIPIQDITHFIGLWQYWDLFAPTPYLIDGRWIIEGYFENGLSYNLYTGTPMNVDVPPPQFGPNVRWVKFEEVMFNAPENAIFHAWGAYYCDEYNGVRGAIPGTRLERVQIRYVYRRSHDPGQPPNDLQTDVLYDYYCFLE